MRTRTLVVTLGATGALTLAGIGVAVAGPGADESTASAEGARASIEQALEGLVEDGTLTSEQVDRIADALADSPGAGHWWGGGHGPGWFGPEDVQRGWEAAAQALGMGVEELQDALAQEGTSLADVAAEQGVATQDLVDDLVAAAREWIDERVADGSLDRERADALLAQLPDRVATGVEDDGWSRWAGGDRWGPGHHGGHPGPGGGWWSDRD